MIKGCWHNIDTDLWQGTWEHAWKTRGKEISLKDIILRLQQTLVLSVLRINIAQLKKVNCLWEKYAVFKELSNFKIIFSEGSEKNSLNK